jgi:hypothetical protein
MVLSFATVGTASAAGTSVVAPAPLPPAGIEVIVVTAKRPTAQPVQPIYEVVVTAKRVSTSAQRTPPTTAIELPKIELAVGGPPVIRL